MIGGYSGGMGAVCCPPPPRSPTKIIKSFGPILPHSLGNVFKRCVPTGIIFIAVSFQETCLFRSFFHPALEFIPYVFISSNPLTQKKEMTTLTLRN